MWSCGGFLPFATILIIRADSWICIKLFTRIFSTKIKGFVCLFLVAVVLTKYSVSWPEVFNSWVFIRFLQDLNQSSFWLPILSGQLGSKLPLHAPGLWYNSWYFYLCWQWLTCVFRWEKHQCYLWYFCPPPFFLKRIVWNKSSVALCLQIAIWYLILSYPSGFSCKNKKPLYLKQKGIWYREFTKSLKRLGKWALGWTSENHASYTPLSWPTSSLCHNQVGVLPKECKPKKSMLWT